MTFHPRMYAKVTGVNVTAPLRTTVVEDMAIDCWTVQADTGAHGHYVSMHPRLTVVLDGAQLSLSTSSNGKPVSASLIFVPGGMHIWGKIRYSKPFRHIDIHIRNKAFSELLGTSQLTANPVLHEASTHILKVAEEIVSSNRLRQTEQVRALARDFLKQVLFAPAPSPTISVIDRVKAYIEGHIEAQLLIADLARIAEMSPTRFKQRFCADTGTSARQWIIARRIERAKSLIINGQPLVEVASATGFSDQAHLNRSFKSATGLPPGKWSGNSL